MSLRDDFVQQEVEIHSRIFWKWYEKDSIFSDCCKHWSSAQQIREQFELNEADEAENEAANE